MLHFRRKFALFNQKDNQNFIIKIYILSESIIKFKFKQIKEKKLLLLIISV